MTRVIEEISAFTPLGIRFWDPARDAQIRDGLHVVARPATAPGPKAQAFRTGSDIYAFHNLGVAAPVDSPPETRAFVVEISDRRRRYLPVAFDVDLPLPYSGVFLSGNGGSPPGSGPAGFYLYSAPTRPAAPGLAVIRGELFDLTGDHAAAHAVVRIVLPAQGSRYGIADEAGRFAVVFPYPAFEESLSGSPGSGEATPLSQRTWDFELEVYYDPAARQALAGTSIPEYSSILGQPLGSLWVSEPASPADAEAVQQWPGSLRLGRELVVKTEGRSQLLVSSQVSL